MVTEFNTDVATKVLDLWKETFGYFTDTTSPLPNPHFSPKKLEKTVNNYDFSRPLKIPLGSTTANDMYLVIDKKDDQYKVSAQMLRPSHFEDTRESHKSLATEYTSQLGYELSRMVRY